MSASTLVEHRPRPDAPDARTTGTADLVVTDHALVAAVVSGNGDADRAVRVAGHEWRVLEPFEVRSGKSSQVRAGATVEHVHTGGGRHEDVLASEIAQVRGDDRTDHSARRAAVPDRRTVRAVQRPHRAADSVVGALDDLKLSIAEHVGQRRTRRGDAIERRVPEQ